MKYYLLLAFITISISVLSQSIDKKTCYAQKITGPSFKIDGVFNEDLWKLATWENNFTQYEPYEGRNPSQQTAFTVLYDTDNLYVGIKAFDLSPDSIVQRLDRRDIQNSDLVGVELDTYNDQRTAFVFAVSAAGVKFDFIISDDGGNEDPTWDPIWWVKTTKDSLGWYAEMRIPLTQLRFENKDIQEWGFQIGRVLFRNNEMSVWQAMDRENSGLVSQFGKLNGIDSIQSKKTIDFMPYTVIRTEQFEKEINNPFRDTGKNFDINAGFDAKIGLTNYLTLDLTVNPDFGQVEADPSEVNLTTFETFFEEKRPFFIEGKNILDYKLMFGDGDLAYEGLFYSRRIGRKPQYEPDLASGEYMNSPESTSILGAAKVTGKTKSGWSVGVLESVAGKEYADIRSIHADKKIPVEPLTNYFVGRLQKDFNKGNTYLGGMLTSVNRKLNDIELNFLHGSAYSGGLDFVHKWKDKIWELDVSLYGSHVTGSTEAITRTQTSSSRVFQRPDAKHLELDSTRTSLSGYGGKILLAKIGGKLNFLNAVTWKSPGLELNDIGYMRQADNILQVFWVGYHIYEPFSIFREVEFNFNQWTNWDFNGTNTSLGTDWNINTDLKNYWEISCGAGMESEEIRANELRGGPALKIPGYYNIWAEVESDTRKKVSAELEASMVQSFEKDYKSIHKLSFELGYRPVNALQISVIPALDKTRSELQYIKSQKIGIGNRYIFGSIDRTTVSASLRINYTVTPELTIQYWGQPFIASGNYSDFKYMTNTKDDDYHSRFKNYQPASVQYNANTDLYSIDDPSGQRFNLKQPDFNVKEFLSNLVVRWEYRPGSTIYLVWSQIRETSVKDGSFDLNRDVKSLFDKKPENIFLLKLSYRFGR